MEGIAGKVNGEAPGASQVLRAIDPIGRVGGSNVVGASRVDGLGSDKGGHVGGEEKVPSVGPEVKGSIGGLIPYCILRLTPSFLMLLKL